MRGFRTKKTVPRSGGIGGIGMCADGADEVPVVTIRGPSPQKRNGKGRVRALEGDECPISRIERESKGICPFFFFSFSAWAVNYEASCYLPPFPFARSFFSFFFF